MSESNQTAVVIEIGGCYERGGRYYIGLNANTLLTFRNGEPKLVHPRVQYSRAPALSVDDLMKIWGVRSEEIDEIAKKYFRIPSPASSRPRVKAPSGWSYERSENYYKCDFAPRIGFRYNEM